MKKNGRERETTFNWTENKMLKPWRMNIGKSGSNSSGFLIYLSRVKINRSTRRA
jgi:hypothetical protein